MCGMLGFLHFLICPLLLKVTPSIQDQKNGRGFTFIIGYKQASDWYLCDHGGHPTFQEGHSWSQIHPSQILEGKG